MGIFDLLSQVANGLSADQHFDQITAQAPTDVLGKGVTAAFQSDKTPDIGQMVGQLFGNSNGSQQAGMLNQLLTSLGPAVLSGLAGGVLAKVITPDTTQITPAQASQLSPQQVQDVINEAHQQNPGIAGELGQFYAQHAGLLKTLGGAALTIAMVKMKDHLSQNS